MLRRNVPVLFALAAALSACAALLNGDPYDPQIENGLNSYHQTASAFIKKMEGYGSTPAGTAESAEGRAFYADMTGLLANLVVKAQANNPKGECPVSAVAAIGLDGLLGAAVEGFEIIGEARAEAIEFREDVKTALAEYNAGTSDLAGGSCLAVTLKVVKSNHELMEIGHREEVHMTPVFARIEQSIVSQGVRIGLLAARASKP